MDTPLYLNTNQKFLRNKKCEAVLITQADFCAKIQQTYQSATYVMELYELVEAWPMAGNDLNSILFDFENYETDAEKETGSLMGLQTLENGLHYWGMYAHGDWEEPVFFIVYWDGHSIRGYIPLLGNTWNPHTGAALGNGIEKLFERLGETAFEQITQEPGFKDPDTQFLEESYGGPLPETFNKERDVKFHWPSLRFDIKNTLIVKQGI
jgi:hypothetical protein